MLDVTRRSRVGNFINSAHSYSSYSESLTKVYWFRFGRIRVNKTVHTFFEIVSFALAYKKVGCYGYICSV